MGIYQGLLYKKREVEVEAGAGAEVGREDDLVLEKKNPTEDYKPEVLLFVS